MNRRSFMQIFATVAAAAVCSVSGASGALAATGSDTDHAHPSGRVLFAQTDGLAGNAIAVFDRAPDGNLSRVDTVSSGGLGGALEGAVVDPLASQGSLLYDREHAMLFAVNAGSNSVAAFTVHGDHVRLRQVLRSGGDFPVSLTRHGNLVYVLNAEGAGTIRGFAIVGKHLEPISRSTRSLGLTPVTGSTQFVNTPGQIAFSPDGDHLLVTTKANGSTIDVFAVGHDGRPSHAFVTNPSSTPVPFAITFAATGRVVVAEAGTSSLSTYQLRHDGSLSPIASVANGQAALCWVALARGFAFGANSGSGTVTSYAPDSSGGYSIVTQTSVDGGPIDLISSPDGRFLYVEAGGPGTIDSLRVHNDGTLTPVGTVSGLAGLEGIAVS